MTEHEQYIQQYKGIFPNASDEEAARAADRMVSENPSGSANGF